jgi:hypothetical protein
MSIKIRLTIQEIVADFEKLIRYHEHLDVLFDLESADEAEIQKFHNEMLSIIEKYLPNYREHLPDEYFNKDTPTFEKALVLYGEVYENFHNMFYQLV